MNRAEWGESIRLYIRATLTFSPTTFDVSFRSFLAVLVADNEGWNEIDDRGGTRRRKGRWKETGQGPAPFFFWPSYCGSLLHAGCPRPAKGLSQRWNGGECQVPATLAAPWTQYIIRGSRTAKSNWRPFACQPGNGAASYHHNRMTRAARAENPPASFPRRDSHNGADRKPQLREPRYSVELNWTRLSGWREKEREKTE